MRFPSEVSELRVAARVLNKLIGMHYELIVAVDCVVRNMSLNFLALKDVKVFATYAKVSLFVDKNLQRVETAHKHPLSNVKLSLVQQERTLDVLLHDFGTHLFLVLVAIEGVSKSVEAVDPHASRVVGRF